MYLSVLNIEEDVEMSWIENSNKMQRTLVKNADGLKGKIV